MPKMTLEHGLTEFVSSANEDSCKDLVLYLRHKDTDKQLTITLLDNDHFRLELFTLVQLVTFQPEKQIESDRSEARAIARKKASFQKRKNSKFAPAPPSHIAGSSCSLIPTDQISFQETMMEEEKKDDDP